jgi:hypothetical protein
LCNLFEEAKDSPYWGGMLQEIEDCNAVSDSEIEFELNTPNSYAQNLLFSRLRAAIPGAISRLAAADTTLQPRAAKPFLKARVTESFKPHLTRCTLRILQATIPLITR